MPKRVEHNQTFEAIDEQGRPYILDVFVEIIGQFTFGNPRGEIEGQKSIYTRDGSSVNRLEKGKYEIVLTGQVLTSDDPDAP